MEKEKQTFLGYVPPAGTKEPGVYLFRQIGTEQTYIGSTVNGYGRFIQHTSALARGEHVNKKFQRAFDESPYFEIEFVKVPPDRQHEEPIKVVREVEQMLLDNFKDKSKLLNIALDVVACGGGISPSPETRAKLSEAMKGRYVSPETRQRQSDALMGHVHSDATKDKQRLAKLGKEQSPEASAKSKANAMLRARQVVAEGVVYESIKATAAAHGIAETTVPKRISSSKPEFKNWSFAD